MVTFCQQIVLVQMLSNWNVTIINKKTNKSSTKSALETNKLTRIESKHSRHKIHEKTNLKKYKTAVNLIARKPCYMEVSVWCYVARRFSFCW